MRARRIPREINKNAAQNGMKQAKILKAYSILYITQINVQSYTQKYRYTYMIRYDLG